MKPFRCCRLEGRGRIRDQIIPFFLVDLGRSHASVPSSDCPRFLRLWLQRQTGKQLLDGARVEGRAGAMEGSGGQTDRHS